MRLLYCFLLFSLPFFISSATVKQKKRVLVFAKTAGFQHASIPKGKEALILMGKQNNFLVDTTEDAGFFTPETLKKYDAVVFLSTTGDVFTNEQQAVIVPVALHIAINISFIPCCYLSIQHLFYCSLFVAGRCAG